MTETEQYEEDIADIDYYIGRLEKKIDKAKFLIVIFDYLSNCPGPSRRIINLEKIFQKNLRKKNLRNLFMQLNDLKIIDLNFSNSTRPKKVVNKGEYFDYFFNQLKLSVAERVSEECQTAQEEQPEATLIMKNGNITIKEKQSLNT